MMPGTTSSIRSGGRRERLEERGDVRDIAYDQETQEWYGYVTKAMDQYGEQIIEGTEQELKSMEGVKPLYERDGNLYGKGNPLYGARVRGPAGALCRHLSWRRQRPASIRGWRSSGKMEGWSASAIPTPEPTRKSR